MPTRDIEKTLSLLNELSTALLLLVLAITSFSINLLPGPDTVEIQIEVPVYESYTLSEGITVSAPRIENGEIVIRSIPKTFSGQGTPAVEVITKEVLFPRLAGDQRQNINANTEMVGTGIYYEEKTVVFDGVNEPGSIQKDLQTILGGIALALLLLKAALWIRLTFKVHSDYSDCKYSDEDD